MAKKIVVFFSHKGENWTKNGKQKIELGFTNLLAHKIQNILNCDIFEIQEKNPYNEDSYEKCTKEAKKDLNNKTLVPIKQYCDDLEKYDEIYLGFPVWWGTYPMPVVTFFSHYSLSKKNIYLFVTHGGGGSGNSLKDVKALLPNCKVDDTPLIIFGDEKEINQATDKIKEWLNHYE